MQKDTVSWKDRETVQKLYLSTKFPHNEIRWNYSILSSEKHRPFFDSSKNFIKDHLTLDVLKKNFSWSKISEKSKGSSPVEVKLQNQRVQLFWKWNWSTEKYSELCQISKMERFLKIVCDFYQLTFFAKRFILDV